MENSKKWVVIDLQTGKFLHITESSDLHFDDDKSLATLWETERDTQTIIDDINIISDLDSIIPYAVPLYFLDYVVKGNNGEDFTVTIYEFIQANGAAVEIDLPYLFLLSIGDSFKISAHCQYIEITRVL